MQQFTLPLSLHSDRLFIQLKCKLNYFVLPVKYTFTLHKHIYEYYLWTHFIVFLVEYCRQEKYRRMQSCLLYLSLKTRVRRYKAVYYIQASKLE